MGSRTQAGAAPSRAEIADRLAWIGQRLDELAIPRFRAAMERFHKEPIQARGVPSPRVKELAAEVYRAVRGWPPAARNTLCTSLFKTGGAEEGALVCYLYRRFARQCHACEFRLFERWLDRYVHNWAHCDGVSLWLLGAALANEPALVGELPAWTASPNRWKRRAAAVALVPAASRGLETAAVFAIAERLLEDPDDLVRKANGWLLKAAYPKKPRETLAFLAAHRERIPRLVLRIAAEKMPAAVRAKVLGG